MCGFFCFYYWLGILKVENPTFNILQKTIDVDTSITDNVATT